MTQLWSSAQFASHDFPEPAYLVDPIIPQGGLVILHGKPGVGKSQLAMSLAHAVANGLPFLGRWPTREGPVIFIQADMTTQIQQERLVHIVDSVPLDNVHWVVDEDGGVPLINIQSMTIAHRDLVEAMRAIDPVLTVWDTLRKIHRLPENASESPIAVYGAAREILPRSSHLFIHHNRKESRDPDSLDTADESFMGNQQWKGSADATATLTEIGGVPRRLMLTFHKARTAPDTERTPMILELDMKTITLQPTRDYP